MTRTRIALGALVLAAAALTLTACSKPNPIATVYSGTSSEWREAACWSSSSAIDATQCAQQVLSNASGGSLATVPVVPGEVVGISVDPVVAEKGWTPRIAGQPLTQTPLTQTYFRFTFPEFQGVPSDGLNMEIIAGTNGDTNGLWLFQLVPAG
ncbi:MAG: hypothetical protein GC156_12570 [Actinomycetales bacterium]|nr:hypothetical protein [Actinomycetales bacterium]